MNKHLILFALAIAILLASCGDDALLDTELNIVASMNGQELQFGQQYTTDQDQGLYFTLFKLYLSELEIVDEAGVATSIADVLLHDLENPESYKVELEAGNYTQLRFGLGLDETLNQSDPNDFEVDHPLSYAQNTHWGWASLYKFMMLEGRCSENAEDDLYNTTFAYHTGTDSLFRQLELPLNLEVEENGVNSIQLSINMDLLFGANAVNVVEENFSHSGIEELPLAIRITDRMMEAFSVN